MTNKESIPLSQYKELPINEMISSSQNFLNEIQKRRTVRTFSDRTFPVEIINNCIKAAATAPSGANMQPWHFVIVSNKEVKKKIRIAAEEEESRFYQSTAPQEWLDALAPLGTDEHKPFLETAPYIIVIFEKKYEELENGEKIKHYYTKESAGIATGVLITALHLAGLATLTHTPSPMNFLNNILERPSNEKPFLILVAGYPEKGTRVPAIEKKPFDKITSFI